MTTAFETYQWVVWLAVTGLIISTLEFWSVAPAFAPNAVYSWKVLQLRIPGPLRRLPALTTASLGVGWTRMLLAVRLGALLAALVAPTGGPVFAVAVGVLVLNTFVFTYRRAIGDDGSDQMSSIILLTLLVCLRPGTTPLILDVGLTFLALQAVLSYSSAGIAKALSPMWRSGEAVYRIFNTATYGTRAIAEVLYGRTLLNKALCWSVILVESLFPLVLLLPAPWGWVFLVWGALFHLKCAVIMGLNSFFWAFAATYPAIIYTAPRLQAWIGLPW